MKTFRFAILAVLLTLVLPALTIAGHHYGTHGTAFMMRSMSDLDTDGDGNLTFDEYVAPHAEKWQKGFNMIDANNDGEIDDKEWNTFLELHGKAAS